MSLTISIRFLTGRAHLHPWQTHHSEGRVEWPPSPWRLLRAIVAVAGRGLTSLPVPDFVVDPGNKPKPTKENPNPVWPPSGYSSLSDKWSEGEADEIPISRLASLLAALTTVPTTWLPKTSGGHTRQYFPIHEGGIVKNTGSVVFDTFAVINKDRPLLFHWPEVDIEQQKLADLKLILGRMSYFGRAESWCLAEVQTASPEQLAGVIIQGRDQTHWPCVCIESGETPTGREYRDYTLERRLAALPQAANDGNCSVLCEEANRLFSELKKPKRLEASKSLKDFPGLATLDWSKWEGRLKVEDGTKGKELHANGVWSDKEVERCVGTISDDKDSKLVRELLKNCMKPQIKFEEWRQLFERSTPEILLLRCLLRESGQDIKNGLERPIGTRWIHYAVPREVYDVPRPRSVPRPFTKEPVNLVRYALNTATVNRPVLPALTDTLLLADRFRSAVMALCRRPSRSVSGHEEDGSAVNDHQHAFWWPLDEDNDGFIDHVMVWAPGGFADREADALRRLTRLRQRGGRPDLLVTPVFVGQASAYRPWNLEGDNALGATEFVSATPYFCPVHLSHGRGKSGRIRPVTPEIKKGLLIQGVITSEEDVASIDEIVFDYDPRELAALSVALAACHTTEPIPPRQFFPTIAPPSEFPALPAIGRITDARYQNACTKDPEVGYCFGTSIGLLADGGTRFIRALTFCRRRRRHEVQGYGRMLRITFTKPRTCRPFAIGSQSHFGLGLFVPNDRYGSFQKFCIAGLEESR